MPRHTAVVVAIAFVVTIDRFVVEGEVLAHGELALGLDDDNGAGRHVANSSTDCVKERCVELGNTCCIHLGGCDVFVLVVLLVHDPLLLFFCLPVCFTVE